MLRVVSCPNCGGTVEFKAGSSLLSVCPYCSSAVARLGDDVGELEILGKVAPLIDLGSPLSLGTFGRWGNLGFRLVGHAQYDHGAGPWNEWYATFDDGRWGWLAEAQGRVYITFGQDVPGLPRWGELQVGGSFAVGKHTLVATEKKVATFLGAEGEMPFAAAPGSETRYVDAEGENHMFATLDYEGETAERIFVGQELDYDQLFDRSVLRDVAPAEAAAAVGLNCPNCGAGIELRAPDEAQRVTCGNCDSLLDASKGNELFLLSSAMPRVPEPLVPLGGEGKLEGIRWTVYGQLVKSVEAWGEKYVWTEYLLHQRSAGFRWLVESEGHWSFVEPVSAGQVVNALGSSRRYEGQRYLRFSSASARVDGLRGEFYWKVAVGDRVSAADYVAPPYMLSEERTDDELTWSRARWVGHAEIAEAFGLSNLPPARGIAPHQPNPHGRGLKGTLRLAMLTSVLLLVLAGFFALTRSEAKVASFSAGFQPTRAYKPTDTSMTGKPLPTERFTVSSGGNLAVRVNADIDSGALFLSGNLVEVGGAVVPVGIRVERYGGYSAGQSWESGARTRTVYVGQIKSGEYELSLRPEWLGSAKRPPRAIRVEVVSDVFLGTHALLPLFLLWILPLLTALRYFGFEKRRWAESDFAE